MNILTTICFRKNSKRFPEKYLQFICGRPLYVWTIELADAWSQGDIVVSTNSHTVLHQLPKWIVPYNRSKELCGDMISKIDVIRDAFVMMEKRNNKQYDVIVDLDICNPMRKIEHIEGALQIAKEINYKYPVVSVTKSYRNPYFNQLESYEQYLGPHMAGLCKTAFRDISRSQDSIETFDMNNAISVFPRSFLIDSRNSTIFGTRGRVAMYIMPSHTFIDIDEPQYLVACEALMKRYEYD